MTAKIMKELYEARERVLQVIRDVPGEDPAKFAYQCGFIEGLKSAIDIIEMEMNNNDN